MVYALKCLGRCEKEKDNETASEGKAKWTVLAYVCGTDLETEGGYATYNIEEIAQTTPNDSVNVVIQTGGTKEWHTEDLGIVLDPKKSNRIRYDKDGFELLQELPLQMPSRKMKCHFRLWVSG
ncbi:hypothetical protein [Butyrivibrio sp. INlla16]|uniref:hypothetical protein n=1 Tax=Butyrivibrio sp. INlla16 TaxID=1520807 RepID=UPI0008854841|nr:hypothetical protein [Butyrivibrio sp. INlla16]SDB10039.1 hypothetical protein SAMN02910263_00450 [Butyrivibrio sp. INlla16]